MPNIPNIINIGSIDNNSTNRIATVNWALSHSNDIITFVNDSVDNELTYSRTFPNWQSTENPYFEYVSELNNLMKNVTYKHMQTYIEGKLANKKTLEDLLSEIYAVYFRYRDLNIHQEPSIKGDEYND